MSNSRRTTVTFTLLLVVGLLASALLLHRLDHIRSRATLQEVLYVSSPKVLKRLSLGYDGLLADVYREYNLPTRIGLIPLQEQVTRNAKTAMWLLLANRVGSGTTTQLTCQNHPARFS